MKKEKYLQVFKYLKQFSEIRSKAVRDIQNQKAQYPEVLWLDDIPVRDIFENVIREDFNVENDYWIKVKKPKQKEPVSPVFKGLPKNLDSLVEPSSLLDQNNGPKLKDYNPEDPSFTAGEEYKTLQADLDEYKNGLWLDDVFDYEEKIKIYEKELAEYNLLNETYKKLFRITNKSKQFGEEYELVLGVGLMNFQDGGQSTKIFRHILTQHVDINFEFSKRDSQILVSPSVEAGPQLETDSIIDLFDVFDSQNIIDAEKSVMALFKEKEVSGLFNDENVQEALQMFCESISPEGSYINTTEKPIQSRKKPTAFFAPALLLRKRNTRSYTALYNKIIETIEDADEELNIPTLNDLIGIHQDISPELVDSNLESEKDTIYFPKEYNDEQIEIVEKAKINNKVLVQGPPGTGKSHTIANLICHLLANGNRILITAYTKRALEVLKEKLPPEFQDLVVNLLSNDSSSLQDLQKSVNSINDELSKASLSKNQSDINFLENELAVTRENIAKSKNELLQIKESSIRDHDFNPDYRGSLTEIAKHIETDTERFSWYKDGYALTDDHELVNQINKFIELKTYFQNSDTTEIESELPLKNELPRIEELNQNIILLNDLKQKFKDKNSDNLIKNTDLEELKGMLIDLKTFYFKANDLGCAHYEDIIEKYKSKNLSSWRLKLKKTAQILDRLEKIDLDRLDREIEIIYPPNKSIKRLKSDAQILLSYLKEGNALSGMSFKLKKAFIRSEIKERLGFINEVLVNGSPCDTLKEFNFALIDLELKQDFEELNDLWSDKQKHEVSYNKSYHHFLQEFKKASKLIELIEESELLRARLQSKIMLSNHQFDLSYINKELENVNYSMAVRENRLFERQIEELTAKLERGQNYHSFCNRLVKNIKTRDVIGYEQSLEVLDSLNHEKEKYNTFKALEILLMKKVPILVSDLILGSVEVNLLNDLESALLFRQAQHELKKLKDKDYQKQVLAELRSLEKNEKSIIADLAAKKAWTQVIESLQTNRSLRKHLDAWVLAVKKIGKTGRGKRALKFRKIAQREMEHCKDSIPCWIMPLYKVAETISPEQGMYDYVIIDEASQLGPDAIFLLYIAKNVIIVGDDKQTSPEYVGVDSNKMAPHIKEHLRGIDHADYYGTEFSFFDHAILFCDGRTVLREHFRCMPEIIDFSDKHFYAPDGNGLYPLRQYSENRMEPLKSVFVNEGFTEGRASRINNEPEAERIADTIAKLIDLEQYKDKTMGVITLQGNQQANVIENLLLKKIGEKEYLDRKIVCGNSSSFQGDERDIIFLSLVTAHNHNRSALSKPEDERRFNVAMSRAIEQVWLFHSVQAHDLSNPNDLRYKLLNHFNNCKGKPEILNSLIERKKGSQPDPFDSWFEVDVYNSIVSKGHSIIPQFEVAKGKYRIDMVAVFKNGVKIGIECDGDRWHGPERYQQDMMRQKVLERCGWQFFRVRGYEYYSNREKALEPLWDIFADSEQIPEVIENENKLYEEVRTSTDEFLNKDGSFDLADTFQNDNNLKEITLEQVRTNLKNFIPEENHHSPQENDEAKNEEKKDVFIDDLDETIKKEGNDGESEDNHQNLDKQSDFFESNDKVLRYFNLMKSGSYMVSHVEDEEADFVIPIRESETDGYLMQCYESGHVNKVPVKTLFTRKLDKNYLNGLNKSDIINSIHVIKKEMILGLYINVKGRTIFKAHKTENISTHDHLLLKGNKVIYFDYSDVIYKFLPLTIESSIDRLIYKSFTSAGKDMSNDYYLSEWKMLSSYYDPEQESIPVLIKNVEEEIEMELESNDQFNIFNKEVKINDVVEIEYLYNQKKMRVRLLDQPTNRNKIINGSQNIFFRSPLGESLIGSKEGEIVKIGKTDTEVVIVRILS